MGKITLLFLLLQPQSRRNLNGRLVEAPVFFSATLCRGGAHVDLCA